MDELQVHDILDTQFGENRPTESDYIIIDEVDYQIIIEWHNASLSVNLYIWPHTDFQDVVPNTEDNCDYYNGRQANPSTIDELPDGYVDTFNTVVKAVKEKYDMTEEHSNSPVVCNMCFPGNGGTLGFSIYLEE